MTKQIEIKTAAFEKGWNAYLAGKTLHENEYRPARVNGQFEVTAEMQDWSDGWFASRESALKNK